MWLCGLGMSVGRYWRAMEEASENLQKVSKSEILVINFGPLLIREELYALFGNNVCEVSNEGAGLGV